MFKLFAILLLVSIVTYNVVKLQQTFLTRSNQHIHNINHKFYGKTNHFGNISFTYNQEKHYTNTSKYMLLVPEKRSFIMKMIK